MKKVSPTYSLRKQIQEKETEFFFEEAKLKEQFLLAASSIKPANLVKNIFSSSEKETHFIDSVVGMTAGYLAKKVVFRSSQNPLVNLAGGIFQLGISNLVSNNPQVVKLLGELLLNKIFRKKKTEEVRK